jgi:hypothetical protein
MRRNLDAGREAGQTLPSLLGRVKAQSRPALFVRHSITVGRGVVDFPIQGFDRGLSLAAFPFQFLMLSHPLRVCPRYLGFDEGLGLFIGFDVTPDEDVSFALNCRVRRSDLAQHVQDQVLDLARGDSGDAIGIGSTMPASNSDRTVVGTAQPFCLLRQEPKGVVSRAA